MAVVNVLARRIRNLNFWRERQLDVARSNQTSHVAVAVAVVGS